MENRFNSKMEYIPERYAIIETDETGLRFLITDRMTGFDDANGRGQRFVDCWNALSNIENPADFVKDFQRMREVVTELTEWSEKYPRGRIYPMSQRKMDDELIAIEEKAKQILNTAKG